MSFEKAAKGSLFGLQWNFHDDYRNKHNLKYHKASVLNRKQIPYEFLAASSNPFVRSDNSKDNQP